MHQLVETRTARRRVPARHRGWGARSDRRLRLLSVALGPEPEWDPVRLGRAHAMRRLRYEPVPGLSPPRRPSGHRRRPAPAGHRRQPRARPGSRVAGRGERECAHWGFIALPQEAERALKAAKGRQRPADDGGRSLRGRPQRDARSRARQTMCRAGDPLCIKEVVTRSTPRTREPRRSKVCEALCRTRTGDPFLTMAVRPCRGCLCKRPKPLHKPRIGLPQRATATGTFRHPLLPTGYPGVDGAPRTARTFGRSPWPTAHARDRATAMVEITTPKLDPAARISFVPLAKLRRVA